MNGYERNFNKLDNKELVEFFRDLLSFALNPTDNTDTQSKSEYAFRQFSAMSENEQAEFCISIRSPQRPCFCTTGIVCTENYCIDRPNCVEPEDVDYGHLLNDYTPSEKSAEESAAEEPANESATDESVADESVERIGGGRITGGRTGGRNSGRTGETGNKNGMPFFCKRHKPRQYAMGKNWCKRSRSRRNGICGYPCGNKNMRK